MTEDQKDKLAVKLAVYGGACTRRHIVNQHRSAMNPLYQQAQKAVDNAEWEIFDLVASFLKAPDEHTPT
jgi:hypothetical protein